MNNCRKIPVVFGIDKKYVLQVFVTIRSILMNSQEHYQFYILSFDDSADEVKIFNDILENEFNNFEVLVRMVDMQLVNAANIYNPHLSKATYIRLLVPEFIPECDKCIYLDCDLIVYGDLKELYEVDLGINYLAGARDCHIIQDTPRERKHEQLLGIPSRDLYVNAGVLVMNLKKIREDKLMANFLAQMKRENWYEDQDVLNYCCFPYIKIVSLKYNLFHFYLGKNMRLLQNCPYTKEEIDFDYAKPFIVHLGGRDKPWNSFKVKKSKEWWEIADIFRLSSSYQLYRKKCYEEEKFDEVQDFIEKAKPRDYVVVWGYSQNGRRLCDILLENGLSNVKAIVDNNPNVWEEEYKGISVMSLDSVLGRYNHILWLISCQVSYNEVIQQLIENGISRSDIVRYINWYEDMLHLLSIDKCAYEDEIKKIASMEYIQAIPDSDNRVKYIKSIIEKPLSNKKEYEYLSNKYNFKYWIETLN